MENATQNIVTHSIATILVTIHCLLMFFSIENKFIIKSSRGAFGRIFVINLHHKCFELV